MSIELLILFPGFLNVAIFLMSLNLFLILKAPTIEGHCSEIQA